MTSALSRQRSKPTELTTRRSANVERNDRFVQRISVSEIEQLLDEDEFDYGDLGVPPFHFVQLVGQGTNKGQNEMGSGFRGSLCSVKNKKRLQLLRS